MLSDCVKLKRKQQGQNESKPTGLITSSRSVPQFCDSVNDTFMGLNLLEILVMELVFLPSHYGDY